MRTHKLIHRSSENCSCAAADFSVAWFLVMLIALVSAGCHKDVAEEASDSDANGYYCIQCEAKLYTPRTVFIGPKCPKCQQDMLVELVGYVCPKDNHLTIRPRVNDRLGERVCDICKGPLGGIRLPREKDLKAWGATKVSS